MTQTEAARRNVLEQLDQRVPTRFYWQLTVLACLGGFLFGYDTSNIGAALNFVPYGLHGLALFMLAGSVLLLAITLPDRSLARLTPRLPQAPRKA